jgi:hypothetical protein
MAANNVAMSKLLAGKLGLLSLPQVDTFTANNLANYLV